MDGPAPAAPSVSAAVPPSGGADAARDAGAAARNARHLRMLEELAEIGMELVRDVKRQALSGPAQGQAKGADVGLVFSRIARAVRQTVALEARLAADAEACTQQVSAAQAVRAAAESRRAKQTKDRIRRCIEDAIRDEADGSDAERLLLDLEERLEDPDIAAELGNRPIGVIVAGIGADLGIEVDLRWFTNAELGYAELADDKASMHAGAQQGGRPGGKSDGNAGPAAPDSGPGGGLAGKPPADPNAAADTGDPPASLKSWLPRTGRDPP